VKYVSTRGTAPRLYFEDAALTGLARDGGLYVPESWPAISHEQIASFAGRPYAEIAAEVMTPFMGEAMPADDLREILTRAYAPFRTRRLRRWCRPGRTISSLSFSTDQRSPSRTSRCRCLRR